MNTELLSATGVGLLMLGILLSAGCLRALAQWPAEYTRKWVHILCGTVAMSFPIWLDHAGYVLLLCLLFSIIILWSGSRAGWYFLHGVPRLTYGALVFPWVVFLCFMMYRWSGDPLFHYVPLGVLAWSDPVAAMAGQRWPRGAFRIRGDHKTLTGAIFFFLTASLSSVALFRWGIGWPWGPSILTAVLVALSATLAESLTPLGLDNLTIPLSSIFILHVQL